MRYWHGYLSRARCKWFAYIWSSWYHCHPIISCFIIIQIGLTFLVLTYPGCPGKRQLNGSFSTFIAVQHLIQSASSVCSTCPNLITKLTVLSQQFSEVCTLLPIFEIHMSLFDHSLFLYLHCHLPDLTTMYQTTSHMSLHFCLQFYIKVFPGHCRQMLSELFPHTCLWPLSSLSYWVCIHRVTQATELTVSHYQYVVHCEGCDHLMYIASKWLVCIVRSDVWELASEGAVSLLVVNKGWVQATGWCQCFDTVRWVTGRTSSVLCIPEEQVEEGHEGGTS